MNTITIIAIATGIIATLAWFAINYIEHGREAVDYAMFEQKEIPDIVPISPTFTNDIKAQCDLILSMYTLGKIDRDTYMSLWKTTLKTAENVADEHLRVIEERVA